MSFEHVKLDFLKVLKHFFLATPKMALVKMLPKYFKVVSVALNQVLLSEPCRHQWGIFLVSYLLFKISYFCLIGYKIFGPNSAKV